MARYSQLAPLDLDTRLTLAILALGFFSPVKYAENMMRLGRTPSPGVVKPLSGKDFLDYLKAIDRYEDPGKYTARIRELLQQLESAGLLYEVGRGNDPFLGTHYSFLRELTKLEQSGVTWLSQALGPEFLHHIYAQAIVQITGVTADGDAHAGTGLIIAPQWLITCRHVLTDMKLDQKQRAGDRAFNVIRQLPHPSVDMGLVEVSPPLPPLPGLTFRPPRIAETVYTLGYPRVPLSKAPALVIQKGEVTSIGLETIHGDQVFLFSAIARPGNSGGPVLSSNGHVLGLVAEELFEDSNNVRSPFFAGIRTDTLSRAIEDLGVKVTLPTETYE